MMTGAKKKLAGWLVDGAGWLAWPGPGLVLKWAAKAVGLMK